MSAFTLVDFEVVFRLWPLICGSRLIGRFPDAAQLYMNFLKHLGDPFQGLYLPLAGG